MKIEAYQSLIQAFVDRSLRIEEFESQYLAAFKSETAGINPVVFQILDKLFSDIDAYSPDCQSGQETDFTISESRLRQQAAIALEKLQQVLTSRSA